MTPQDLEAAYDQTKWAPNMALLLARFATRSDAVRAAVGEPARISYGAGKDEGLDLYRAEAAGAPTVVFVHGGGWRRETAREQGFLAKMLLAAGIHFVALDFSSVVDAKGDLSTLVDQVRRALVWISRNCASFGGDSERLYLVGHSSGAHLAAMALSTRWTDHGLGPAPIRGGVLISGIYDLEPVRHTSRSEYVHFDDRIVRDLSPLHQIAEVTSPLLLAVGSRESPEFLRQTKEYARAVTASGRPANLIVGETYNHFEILETLGSPDGFVGQRLLELIGSGHR